MTHIYCVLVVCILDAIREHLVGADAECNWYLHINVFFIKNILIVSFNKDYTNILREMRDRVVNQ
jgi:hypothetical protein